MHRTVRCVLPLCGAAILLFVSLQHGSTADPRDEAALIELGPSDQTAAAAEARLREAVFSSRLRCTPFGRAMPVAT